VVKRQHRLTPFSPACYRRELAQQRCHGTLQDETEMAQQSKI
jgi:hypothetical protein